MKTLVSEEYFGTVHRMVRVTEGLSLAMIVHDAGLIIPRHQHDYARICIVMNGQLSENHGAGYEDFPAGWLLFWPPGVVHEDRFGPSRNRTLQIEFSPVFFQKISDSFPRDSPSPIAVSALEDSVPRLCAELQRSDPAASLAIEGAIYEIIARAARLSGRTSATHTWRVRRALDYLNANLGSAVTPGSLAAAVGISTTQLNHRFHEELGMSLTQYIRTVRAQYAAAILRHSDLPVGEAAAQAGYYDSSHMTREFRALFGTTPRGYRELWLGRERGAYQPTSIARLLEPGSMISGGR